MTLLLLLTCALALSYACALFAESLGEQWRAKRQELRLRDLLTGKREAPGGSTPLTRALERVSSYTEGTLAWVLRTSLFRGHRLGIENLLRRSGRGSTDRSERAFGAEVMGALLGGLLFGLLGGPLGFFLGALGGLALPTLTLQDEARRREGRILRELPDALESFSLCVEAGLTLDQAWAHYLAGTEPHPWSEELSLVVRQVQAGSSRKDALTALSQRLDLTDVSLFVSSVTHAERTGTGVGATLRRLGATLRDKQTQRAEKSVQELPVKLLLPLLLCVMPVTLLVLFAPILLKLIYG